METNKKIHLKVTSDENGLHFSKPELLSVVVNIRPTYTINTGFYNIDGEYIFTREQEFYPPMFGERIFEKFSEKITVNLEELAFKLFSTGEKVTKDELITVLRSLIQYRVFHDNEEGSLVIAQVEDISIINGHLHLWFGPGPSIATVKYNEVFTIKGNDYRITTDNTLRVTIEKLIKEI